MTHTDITKANKEIIIMETHMNVMKRMISVQSQRIETLKAQIATLEKNIDSKNAIQDNYIHLMKMWLKMLEEDNKTELVMESIDRVIHFNKEGI